LRFANGYGQTGEARQALAGGNPLFAVRYVVLIYRLLFGSPLLCRNGLPLLLVGFIGLDLLLVCLFVDGLW